jgi:hypothetical protein
MNFSLLVNLWRVQAYILSYILDAQLVAKSAWLSHFAGSGPLFFLHTKKSLLADAHSRPIILLAAQSSIDFAAEEDIITDQGFRLKINCYLIPEEYTRLFRLVKVMFRMTANWTRVVVTNWHKSSQLTRDELLREGRDLSHTHISQKP